MPVKLTLGGRDYVVLSAQEYEGLLQGSGAPSKRISEVAELGGQRLLAEKLLVARTLSGLSQTEVTDRLRARGLPVTQSVVSLREKNKAKIPHEYAEALLLICPLPSNWQSRNEAKGDSSKQKPYIRIAKKPQ